jgi:hypothetical protein
MKVRLTALVSLLAACDPGDVLLLAPETSSPQPTLSIHAVLDTPYAALAGALGWTAGVPAAAVRVHLMTEPYDSGYWHQATADGTGLAQFSGLLGGLYEVEVTRALTSTEATQTGARSLAGGGRLYVPTSGPADLALEPDRQGSLVFSEIEVAVPIFDNYTSYEDAVYFEIYNNSDTTIYLDGKYWGIGWDLNYNFPYWPCDQTAPIRNDPDGIWTRLLERFPGRGTDHALAPGQAAVVAKAAIDHQLVYPGLYDLSGAAFEWTGTSGADNPDVPNLEDIGPSPMGYHGPGADAVTFLSEPVDLATLPSYVDPHSGKVLVRIPLALILDASSSAVDWTKEDYQPEPACLEVANKAFERLPGPAYSARLDFQGGLSYQRRILQVQPDGRKLLQDTNTSMFDFVKAPRTPGWIPDSLPEQP